MNKKLEEYRVGMQAYQKALALLDQLYNAILEIHNEGGDPEIEAPDLVALYSELEDQVNTMEPQFRKVRRELLQGLVGRKATQAILRRESLEFPADIRVRLRVLDQHRKKRSRTKSATKYKRKISSRRKSN